MRTRSETNTTRNDISNEGAKQLTDQMVKTRTLDAKSAKLDDINELVETVLATSPGIHETIVKTSEDIARKNKLVAELHQSPLRQRAPTTSLPAAPANAALAGTVELLLRGRNHATCFSAGAHIVDPKVEEKSRR